MKKSIVLLNKRANYLNILLKEPTISSKKLIKQELIFTKKQIIEKRKVWLKEVEAKRAKIRKPRKKKEAKPKAAYFTLEFDKSYKCKDCLREWYITKIRYFMNEEIICRLCWKDGVRNAPSTDLIIYEKKLNFFERIKKSLLKK